MFAFSTNTLTDGLSRQESKLASSKISLKISALFKLKSLSLSPLVGLFLAFTLVGCGGGGGGGVDRNNPITSADAKAPTITSQPQSATYTKGATPNALTVSAEVDAGVLSYQWHSNSVDNNESGTEIRGEVANTFTPPTDVVGETYYYVVVTNTNPAATGAKTASKASDMAKIEINELVNAAAPAISSQPQSAAYTIGDTPTALSVTATSPDGGDLSYQWYSNTANTNSGGAAIQGETSPTFTPSTAAADTYYYYVVVTNTKAVNGANTANATSNPATITVNALVHAGTPDITSQPQGTTYDQGESAVALSVTATSPDSGVLSYQWYSSATNTNAGGTPLGTNSASFTPPTTTAGTAYYYVVVTNTKDSATGSKTATATSQTAKIVVNELVNAKAPSITVVNLADANYFVGNQVTALSVTATSLDGGSLTYQWYSAATANDDGTPINSATQSSYTPSSTVTSDLYYYVVVTNTAAVSGAKTATAASAKVHIVVNELVNAKVPDITAQPQSAGYEKDDTPTALSVSATSPDGGTLSYQWYSSATNINSGGTLVGTSETYTPPTTTTGTKYYYVVVTNINTAVNGDKTASVTSNTAEIVVTLPPARYTIKCFSSELNLLIEKEVLGGSIAPSAPEYCGTGTWYLADGSSPSSYIVNSDVNFYAITGVKEIRTQVELNNIRNSLSGKYVLINDIHLTDGNGVDGTTGWEPIGLPSTVTNPSNSAFIFNGDGHKITGLWINRTVGGLGLFGSVKDATIKNLGVEIGEKGIVGGSESYIGGIAGFFQGGSITNSYSAGSVSGTGNFVGGIAGDITSSGSITNSYSTANVSGARGVGGIAGRIRTNATINKSHSTGNISGGSYVGGIAGEANNGGPITNSVAINPSVNGTNRVVGRAGSLTNNFALDAMLVNGNPRSSTDANGADGADKTDIELKKASTYEGLGWDFTTIWKIDPSINNGYPYLY